MNIYEHIILGSISICAVMGALWVIWGSTVWLYKAYQDHAGWLERNNDYEWKKGYQRGVDDTLEKVRNR